MPLAADQLRRIADLAALDLDESVLAGYAADLDAILDWVAILDDVDVTGVEPLTSGAFVELRLRADVVAESDRRAALFANAPEFENDFFIVPKIIE